MIYSESFLSDLSEYVGGDDRLELEAYTRVEWSGGLLNAFKPYTDLPGKDFLDAGCGHGVLALAAHKEGMNINAFDFVEKAVGLANRRFQEEGISTTAFRHDLRASIPDGYHGRFDLITCYQVLEHMPRARQFEALRHLCEMVKPGGFLFIDTENLFYPHDQHDTGLPLVRLLAPAFQRSIVEKLEKGIAFFEPSFGDSGERTDLHDYMTYDEIVGATKVLGFDAVNPFVPHGTARQMFFSKTGSHWFYETVAQYFEAERFMPISVLFQKVG